MPRPEQLHKAVSLIPGDCLIVLPTLPENSIDAVVCDPPYHLQSIVKRFAKISQNDKMRTTKGPHQRTAKGFMDKKWDGGNIAFRPETWEKVYRVLKPGAHLLAMGGTRTYHLLVSAIENAGFEIRDCVLWIYGQGFPKSHDVSKGIDRAAKAKRKIVAPPPYSRGKAKQKYNEKRRVSYDYPPQPITVPATDEAQKWEGWGTALKPACELIVIARKPLSEKTIAANVLKWGVGALNIKACRVPDPNSEAYERNNELSQDNRYTNSGSTNFAAKPGRRYTVKRLKPRATLVKTGGNWRPENGVEYHGELDPERWPANVIHDDYDYFPKRIFYTAKADADDRLSSDHPTIKPLSLLRYLIKLACPKGGTIIDPFAGSGTTAEAAYYEGMNTILIEQDPEYQKDIRERIRIMKEGGYERDIAKAKRKPTSNNQGLFRDPEGPGHNTGTRRKPRASAD